MPGGGAQAQGPWIRADGTFDFNAKAVVEGEVSCPAEFFVFVESGRRVVASNNLPRHPTGVFPVAPGSNAFCYDRNPNADLDDCHGHTHEIEWDGRRVNTVPLPRHLGVSVYAGVFSRAAATAGWGYGEFEAAGQAAGGDEADVVNGVSTRLTNYAIMHIYNGMPSVCSCACGYRERGGQVW